VLKESDVLIQATYEGEIVLGRHSIAPEQNVILSAGSNEVTLQFTPSDSRFSNSSIRASILVSKGVSTINWLTPVPIVFPQRLTKSELNAECSTPSATKYDPPIGTFLMVGTHELTAICIPDDKNYSTASTKVNIQVLFPPVSAIATNKSTPTISWRTPKTFIAPFILDEKSLKATCSVTGRVSYDAQIGTKYEPGIHSIKAVCVPTDTDSWNLVESKLEFEVLSPTYRSSFLFKLNSSGLDSIEKVQVKAIQVELQKYGNLQCISYLNSNMLKIAKEVSLAKKRALAVCKALTIGTKIKYTLSVSAIKGSPVATRRNLLKPFRVDVVLSN
jgi:hypothetical protein